LRLTAAAVDRSIDRFNAAYKAAIDKNDNAAIEAAQRELRTSQNSMVIMRRSPSPAPFR
jgi:hypothetical protein